MRRVLALYVQALAAASCLTLRAPIRAPLHVPRRAALPLMNELQKEVEQLLVWRQELLLLQTSWLQKEVELRMVLMLLQTSWLQKDVELRMVLMCLQTSRLQKEVEWQRQ